MKVNDHEVVAFADRKAERMAAQARKAKGSNKVSFFGAKEPKRVERRSRLTKAMLLDY